MADDIYGESRVTAKSNNSTNDTLRQVSSDYVFCLPDSLMWYVRAQINCKMQIKRANYPFHNTNDPFVQKYLNSIIFARLNDL